MNLKATRDRALRERKKKIDLFFKVLLGVIAAIVLAGWAIVVLFQ